MSDTRTARYRRLALAEPDPEKARLLNLLAEEAQRGVLCVASHRTTPVAKLELGQSTAIMPAGR